MAQVKSISLPKPLRKVALARANSSVVTTSDEIEAAKKESYQRGCADTAALTEKHLLDQRDELIHLQQKTFAGLIAQNYALVEQLRAVLPDLVLEGARRVLAQTEIDRDLVVRLIEEILAEISDGRQAIEVSLSAHDLALFESVEDSFREKYPEIEFRIDSELQPGECVARSRHGAIDGRFETKLKTVRQAFK